jgi:hypothetical protein
MKIHPPKGNGGLVDRWTAALTFALLVLGGCTEPAPDRSADDHVADVMQPLPDAIHDERDVVVSSSGSAANLPCGDVRQCAHHPFTLPRTAQLAATLSWSVSGNIARIRVLQAGEPVLDASPQQPNPNSPADVSPQVTVHVVLAAGEYVLRVDTSLVMAADHWVLDARFEEVLSRSGYDVGTVAMDCAACFEPTVAAGLDGTLYVIDGLQSDIAVSDDEGQTWEVRPAPPVPGGASSGYQTDSMIQVSPAGRLYFSAMIAREVTLAGTYLATTYIDGVQVAWSDDGARTWQSSHVTLSPERLDMLAVDRQWLGFGPGGEVYLSYLQQPAGIWIMRSDDGGATWGPSRQVVAPEDGQGGNHGPPVVDGEGRVFVPKCNVGPSARLDDTGPTPGLYVYVSEDQGVSWAERPVASEGCIHFPILAAAPDGSLVVAWHDMAGGAAPTRGDVYVSRSTDAGGSWSEPIRWGEGTHTSPWPLVRDDGSLDLVWYAEDADSSSHAVVAHGRPDEGPLQQALLPSFDHGIDRHSPQSTDFAHAARLPDGRIVVIWADQKVLTLAVQEPTAAAPVTVK